MFERDVPVYLITGFLESGKTRFLDFTIRQQYFQIPDLTLLLVCEEGEEEYDPAELKKCNTVMEVIENPEDFTLETLKALDKKYRPERVLIEYNPLWSVAKLYEMTMPRGWDMAQHPDLYEQYEIHFHGNDPGRGYGDLQPVPAGQSAGQLPQKRQGGEPGGGGAV